MDVSEAFSVGELSKGHGEKLIPAREAFDFVVPVVSLYTLAELVDGKEVHELRGDRPASIHEPSPSAGLQKTAFGGASFEIWKSTITRYFVAATAAGIALTTINIHGHPFDTWAESLRHAAFQVVSLGTTTGFATADSTLWPPFAHLLLIFFILQGACAGSTSGAIKVDRIVIFGKSIIRRIKMIQHPSAVVPLKINKSAVGEDTVEFTLLYISAYLGVVFVSTLLLTLMDVDLLTAFSGAAATMGGVGPGFGTVGSMSNFSQIPEAGKWVLSMNMLLGRLEIFSVIIFLMPRSWR